MDVNMPKMDGFEATRIIMESNPVPVVIVSSVWKPDEVATTFRAVEAGAVAVVAKPSGPEHRDHAADVKRLVDTVRLMSEVRVVRRRWRNPMPSSTAPIIPTGLRSETCIVAIGASTGGPTVLQTILSSIPKTFPVPILMVQHIAQGFTQGLTQWLAETSGFNVRIATQFELAMPATAYFAPEGNHIAIGRDGRIVLSTEPPDNGIRPSIGRLFASVAAAYASRGAGVLLTGMGRDGAEQLKLIRERGGLSIAQNKESSLVFGMPGEAIKLQAAEHVLSPSQIAALLTVATRPKS
jgi:two-component system chemotaxis response regulator CheB